MERVALPVHVVMRARTTGRVFRRAAVALAALLLVVTVTDGASQRT